MHLRKNGKMGSVCFPFFLSINAIHSAPEQSAFYVPCSVLGARNILENKVFLFMKSAFQWGNQTIIE